MSHEQAALFLRILQEIRDEIKWTGIAISIGLAGIFLALVLS